MTVQRLAAVTIDLDEIGCYTRIHGLGEPPPDRCHQVYLKAVPRLERMLSELAVEATFFVVGRDLSAVENAITVQRLHRSGHEIGNHTASHPYRLTSLPECEMHREVLEGARAIAECTGQPPAGFRAPGYTMSDKLMSVLARQGVTYDSSVFPCPWYWSAKAAAITWIGLRGRKSHSVIDSPTVLRAPAEPYRVGRRYWQRGDGILEIPIGVTSNLTGRLPFIGTALTLAGTSISRGLTSMICGRSFVNLELHGIDLADQYEDGLEFLAPYQPDLRRSAIAKEAILRQVISHLKQSGFTFVTLQDAASIFDQA